MMARIVLLAAAAISLPGCVTIAWDGGYPSGEVRISVTDRSGGPLDGVLMEVVDESEEPALGYPIDEIVEGSEVRSDSEGRIVVHQLHDGMQFGGTSRYLFGFIPLPGNATAPVYHVRFSKEGYRALEVDFMDLFRSPYVHYLDFPRVRLMHDGRMHDYKVYTQTFQLRGSGKR